MIRLLIGIGALPLIPVAATAQETSCASRGPIPGPAITIAEREAVPLASSGYAFVSIASARTVLIIDLATGEQTALDAGIADAHEVAVSPDGRWGVAADFGDYTGDYRFTGTRLAVFDLRTKSLARIIDIRPNQGPHDVVFVSPTRLIVTTQTTRNVTEVDVVSGQVLGTTSTGGRGSHSLAISDGGRLAFVANQGDGSLSRLDLANRRLLGVHKLSSAETEGIAATPDGSEVWMGFGEHGVVVVNGRTGAPLDTLTGFMSPHRIAMSDDGTLAAIVDFRCEVLQVADVPNRRVLGPVAGLEGAGVAKFLPDNRTAIVLMLDERVLAMADLRTRRVIARHTIRQGRPDASAWGPVPR